MDFPETHPALAGGVDAPAAEKTSTSWRELALSGPIAAAVISGLLALFVAVVVPDLTQRWQDHARRLQVRTLVATDMSKSFTLAIGAGQRVGNGLVLEPVLGDPQKNAAAIQQDYNQGLASWRVDSGRLTAELSARFPDEQIIGLWRSYVRAVTQFYRLGAVIPDYDRSQLLGSLKTYLASVDTSPTASAPQVPDTPISWTALHRSKKFGKSLSFRTNYNALSDKLTALGEGYVQLLLTLKPIV